MLVTAFDLIGVTPVSTTMGAERGTFTGLAGIVGDAGMVPIVTGSADLVTCIEMLEQRLGDAAESVAPYPVNQPTIGAWIKEHRSWSVENFP